MNQELKSHFDEFEKPEVVRRKLLPWWIKVFCWIFMLMAVFAVGSLITNLFVPNVNLSLYGFSTDTAYSGTGIFIISVMLLKGFAAFSLWFEKPNAIMIAKIDAIIGIAICIASLFILPFSAGKDHFSFRLEIFLLIPYYIKVNKIEYEWDNLETI